MSLSGVQEIENTRGESFDIKFTRQGKDAERFNMRSQSRAL